MTAAAKPWMPSNRCAIRICVVLFRAHRDDRIELSFPDFYKVRDGMFSTRIGGPRRVALGRLWRAHGSLELARAINQLDKIPADVIDELKASA